MWARLLPWPSDPATVVDVLYACSGGALKSRSFWVVREMIRAGLWQPAGLDRFACVPDGRVRKRAARMGLIDLDEKADAIDDMKAVSAALFAALGLGGTAPARTSTYRCRPPSSAARCATGSEWPNALCPTAGIEGRRWGATEGSLYVTVTTRRATTVWRLPARSTVLEQRHLLGRAPSA